MEANSYFRDANQMRPVGKNLLPKNFYYDHVEWFDSKKSWVAMLGFEIEPIEDL